MYTIDISKLRPDGRPQLELHAPVLSLPAALRVADSHAPAPLNVATRTRIRREHGGVAKVGQVLIAIACEF
jgi:hypothetical protein